MDLKDQIITEYSPYEKDSPRNDIIKQALESVEKNSLSHVLIICEEVAKWSYEEGHYNGYQQGSYE